MGEGHYSGDSPEANQRLTVREAADVLGISEAAVRNRIKRGTLRSEKVSGRVYVVLAGAINHDESSGEPADESELVAVLREQLAAEREANREMRRLLAGLIERIPELEASRDEQNQVETAEPRSDRVERHRRSLAKLRGPQGGARGGAGGLVGKKLPNRPISNRGGRYGGYFEGKVRRGGASGRGRDHRLCS